MYSHLQQVLEGVLPYADFTSKALVSDGYFNSITLADAVGELSVEYGITIPCDEITPDNFNSLEAIAAMVRRLGGNPEG